MENSRVIDWVAGMLVAWVVLFALTLHYFEAQEREVDLVAPAPPVSSNGSLGHGRFDDLEVDEIHELVVP
jgi:hypothetical protein